MARPAPALRYLFDEDVNPEVARIAARLGFDVVSVHDLGRRGLSDLDQLRFAAMDGRIVVTRNRDDFIVLTVDAFRAGDPHHGVLILPHTVRNDRPAEIARVLEAWHGRWQDVGYPGDYFIDFVS